MCREYSWFQTPCEDSLEFSCKWSSIVPPTTPTGPPQGDCPDGWLDIMVGTVQHTPTYHAHWPTPGRLPDCWLYIMVGAVQHTPTYHTHWPTPGRLPRRMDGYHIMEEQYRME